MSKLIANVRSTRITDEQVADVLARCLANRINYPSPDERAVSRLTRLINQYIDKPWDETSIAALRDRARKEREEAETLHASAVLLARDLDQWRKYLSTLENWNTCLVGFAQQKVQELTSAIATLETPRGRLDHPGFTLRLSDGGPPPKPWALTAAGLADEIHRILKDGGDLRAGLGGADGPVTKAVAIFLRVIFPGQTVPKRSTINETIENHLSRSLTYRRRGY